MKYLMITITFSILLFSCKTSVISEKKSNETKSVDLTANDFIKNLSSLTDSGFIVEPVIYKVSKQIEKKFQNHTIPIKICATFQNDRYGVVDSLIIFFENKQHNIYIGSDYSYLSIPNHILSVEGYIEVNDYNFDNKPDIAFYNNTGSGTKNSMKNIYIFDKMKKTFFLNRILSETANCCVDTTNKTISTFWQYGMASRLYGSSTYIWENDKLTEVKNVNQSYIDSLNVFVRTTRELIDNTWILKVDTLTEDDVEW